MSLSSLSFHQREAVHTPAALEHPKAPTPRDSHTVGMDLALYNRSAWSSRSVRFGAVFHHLTGAAFSFTVVGKELEEGTE